jgi:hypothetical protein
MATKEKGSECEARKSRYEEGLQQTLRAGNKVS